TTERVRSTGAAGVSPVPGPEGTSPEGSDSLRVRITAMFLLRAELQIQATATNRLHDRLLDIHQKTTPGETGLEPATPGFGDRCTTNCATRLLQLNAASS